ncbi:MAG: EpsG family protein [Prevotella sp.]|nr:EpsG family protein [Prevotella sp.]
MLIYIIPLMVILYFILSFSPAEQAKGKVWLGIWVLSVAMICGLSDMLGGYDRYIYGQVFDYTADDRAIGVNLFTTTAFLYADKEFGYALYNYLVTYITSNRYIFILITTLVVFGMLYRHIIVYSRYPVMSFFILFCVFYFFTFTYFRQVMAVCVAWYAIPYAIQRRPIPFFAIIILAMTFHNSALLFSGIYFVANYRFTKKQIYYVILGALLLGLTPISSFLFNSIGGAVNEEKADLSASQVGGARIAYIVEAGFFLYIILKRYHRVGWDKKSLCMLNTALGFIFILCFFVRFPDGGRMSWYYLIGVASCLSEIMVKENKRSDIRLISIFIFIVLYLRILNLWGIQLRPYKSFLTNGVRPNDPIEEQYEYDHAYDKDKFYRPAWGGINKKNTINQ